MATITKHVSYNDSCVKHLSEQQGSYPVGLLLELSINPYTGNVVLAWQDREKALPFIAAILDNLSASEFYDVIKDITAHDVPLHCPDDSNVLMLDLRSDDSNATPLSVA